MSDMHSSAYSAILLSCDVLMFTSVLCRYSLITGLSTRYSFFLASYV